MSVWQNLPEEVGWYLPPSACLLYLQYLSGPVWSNACRQPCASFDFPLFFFFFFKTLSLFFFSHDRHGWIVPLLTFSSLFSLLYLYPWFFFVCPPFLHYHLHLHLSFSFWANFTILDSSRPFSWDPSDWVTDRWVGEVKLCEMHLFGQIWFQPNWTMVPCICRGITFFFFMVQTFALVTGSWGSMLL